MYGTPRQECTFGLCILQGKQEQTLVFADFPSSCHCMWVCESLIVIRASCECVVTCSHCVQVELCQGLGQQFQTGILMMSGATSLTDRHINFRPQCSCHFCLMFNQPWLEAALLFRDQFHRRFLNDTSNLTLLFRLPAS